MNAPKRRFFFDMDGTLTESRTEASPAIRSLLAELAQLHDVIVVSGAERVQIDAQLPFLAEMNVYILAESGNDAMRDATRLWRNLLTQEERGRINAHIANIAAFSERLDMKHRQLEERAGQTSYSMVGHDAPLPRKAAYDPEGNKRSALLKRFPFQEADLQVRIGGTTTFDYSRRGWGKAGNISALLEANGWEVQDCVYIGDRLHAGGNDYEVIERFPLMSVHPVQGPADTERFILDALARQDAPR